MRIGREESLISHDHDYNAGPWGGASYRLNTEAGRYYEV